MDEKDLVRRSKAGEEEAFGVLVNTYKTKVYHLAFSLTHNAQTADDLAQEVFIKAYFALEKFQEKSGFGTWIYRIAVNHCRDFLRKKNRMTQIPLENIIGKISAQEVETHPEEKEQEETQRRKLVHTAIQTLPAKYRIILTLRDIQDFPYNEITKILDISPGTVDSRLHRARKMLRKKLEPYFSQKGE
ncbi:MAG: sigma-70 family RNA polymerase sigma factor, partial [Candidatus Aminicenantes bacterium]|nr:sigma-70 family RNA polymerase sigma factor [Candidatus Aminicenantes bacterium]